MDYLQHIHSMVFDIDRVVPLFFSVLIAIVVGMITGPWRNNANPFWWECLDIFFGNAGDKLNNPKRKPGDLMFRGLIFTVVVLLFMLLVGNGLQGVINAYPYLNSFVVAMGLTAGAVWFAVLRLYFAMTRQNTTKGAYMSISRSSRVNLNTTDDYGITREGIIFCTISFDKGMVAPALWYLIGGLPVMLVYSSLSFMAWRFGRWGNGRGFAAVPCALERLMGYVPSLFTGALYTAAAAVAPTVSIKGAFVSWWRSAGKTPYEQYGTSLCAVAWPLNVVVGGAIVDIDGRKITREWIGPKDASAKTEAGHLKRVIVMNVVAHLIFVLAFLSTYIYAGRIGF